MNIFEDLIDELKEENLLEATVIETGGRTPVKNGSGSSNGAAKKSETNTTVVAVTEKTPEAPIEITAAAIVTNAIFADEKDVAATVVADDPSEQTAENDLEFYRKRAMDEVAFLQMVEYVFAGVEREQLKIVPKPHNDLEVKKILHSFVQMTHSPQSAEHAQAQFQLMQETESWHSSLALRDDRLTTAHLRRFCETSRPPLSSPALVALARFYRNSPYSEPVRNKFDLIVTRLFSKETGEERREAVFTRAELVSHLTELYAEWSSVPLYSVESGDAEIAEIAERFDEFIGEADEAESFDELIKNDFYTRLHSFKRGTNENFYSPLVTAVGIESNIRIGNRYVALLEAEKQKGNVAGLEDRYGFSQDISISEATGKTFSLIELLNQRKPIAFAEEKPAAPIVKSAPREKAKEAKQVVTEKTAVKKAAEPKGDGNLTRWLLVAAVVAGLALVVYLIARASSP